MAGVTTAGFEGRSFDEVFESAKATVRGLLGDGVTFIPQSPETVLYSILAEEVGDAWAMGEGIYLAFNRASAAGAALDNIGALTGTARLQATASTVALTVTGDVGTVLPAGRVASVESTGTAFSTLDEVALVAAPAWTVATVYALGARVTTSNPTARVYQCRVAGASAGSGTGPAGQGAVIADGTAGWKYVGEGAAVADVDAACTVSGPVAAAAGTVTQKDTPVAGWQSVTNLQDAVLGRNVETDADYRLRQVRELRGLGKGSLAAMQAVLGDPDVVPGVRAVTVFENTGSTVNADGMPGHSFEVLIEGGEDAVIRQVIWETKPAGIYPHGTVSGTVTDSEGGVHTVRHTRPGILTVYVVATVQLTPEAPVEDEEAEAQLAAALIAYGDALPAARDVVLNKAKGALTALPWVHDVSALTLGLTLGTVGAANIPVTSRQRADFDSSRVVLTLQRLTEGEL